MSAQSTLQSLQQSGESIVDFIIQNNPSGVQGQMDSIQLLPDDMATPSYADMKAAVMDLVSIGNDKAMETFQYVLSVDYVDENTNYTGGLREELEQGVTQAVGEGGRGSVWMQILDGVFDVTESVFGFLTLQQQADVTGNIADAAQSDYKRNTLFGIPKEIVLAMIAVIGIIALVAIAKPKK